MRNHILSEPTGKQSQTTLSEATADVDSDQTDGRMLTHHTATATPKNTTYGEQFFVHYTHEKRLSPLKKDVHQIYDDVFRDTPAMYTKMRVCTRKYHPSKKRSHTLYSFPSTILCTFPLNRATSEKKKIHLIFDNNKTIRYG